MDRGYRKDEMFYNPQMLPIMGHYIGEVRDDALDKSKQIAKDDAYFDSIPDRYSSLIPEVRYSDLRNEIEINICEAYTTITKKIIYITNAIVDYCNGDGIISEEDLADIIKNLPKKENDEPIDQDTTDNPNDKNNDNWNPPNKGNNNGSSNAPNKGNNNTSSNAPNNASNSDNSNITNNSNTNNGSIITNNDKDNTNSTKTDKEDTDSSNKNGGGSNWSPNGGGNSFDDLDSKPNTGDNSSEGNLPLEPDDFLKDEEDIYTIPMAASSSVPKENKKKINPVPILAGLGLVAASGAGAKIYSDYKKDKDNALEDDEFMEDSDLDGIDDFIDSDLVADEWVEPDNNEEKSDETSDYERPSFYSDTLKDKF